MVSFWNHATLKPSILYILRYTWKPPQVYFMLAYIKIDFNLRCEYTNSQNGSFERLLVVSSSCDPLVILLAIWCIFVDLCHDRCVQLPYLYASCFGLFTSPGGVRRQLLSATPAHNAVPFICQSWYASGENVNPPAPSAKQTSAHTRYRSRSISLAAENCVIRNRASLETKLTSVKSNTGF